MTDKNVLKKNTLQEPGFLESKNFISWNLAKKVKQIVYMFREKHQLNLLK